MKIELNRELKNIHSELITLFVKRGGIESRVDIPPGESIIIDDYETPTIRVYKKKNLIKIESSQLYQSDSFAWLKDNETPAGDAKDMTKTIVEAIEQNKVEAIDQSYTIEDHKAILLDDDMKSFKENIMKNLTRQEAPTRFDIVEGEVDKYVEDGYIKGEWSSEEIAFLKKNYPVKGRKYCSTELNRNESSVQKKINSLGIKKKKKKK